MGRRAPLGKQARTVRNLDLPAPPAAPPHRHRGVLQATAAPPGGEHAPGDVSASVALFSEADSENVQGGGVLSGASRH